MTQDTRYSCRTVVERSTGDYVAWSSYDSGIAGKDPATAPPAPSHRDGAGEEGNDATREHDATEPAPWDR